MIFGRRDQEATKATDDHVRKLVAMRLRHATQNKRYFRELESLKSEGFDRYVTVDSSVPALADLEWRLAAVERMLSDRSASLPATAPPPPSEAPQPGSTC